MIYRVTSESTIRDYIQSELAEDASHLSSLIALPPSPSRDADIRFNEKSTQSDLDTLTLLNHALFSGKSSGVVFRDNGFQSFVSFAVRDDGLIRCFESNSLSPDHKVIKGSCSVANVSSLAGGIKAAKRYRDKARAANDFYGVYSYSLMFECKKAVYLVAREASENGVGEAEVVLDGDVVKRVEAIRSKGKIAYVVYPVFTKYFE